MTIPFESYARLIRTIAPLARKVLFYDHHGRPAWISDGTEEPELHDAVAQFLEDPARFDDDAATFTIGAENFLLFATRREEGGLVGLLGVICQNRRGDSGPGKPEITRRLLAPVLDIYRHGLSQGPAATTAAPRATGGVTTMSRKSAAEHCARLCDTALQYIASEVECAFAAIVVPGCGLSRYLRTSENESDLSVGAAVGSIQAAMFKWMALKREAMAINRIRGLNDIAGRYKVAAVPVMQEAGQVVGLMLLFRESSSGDFLANDLEYAGIACRSLSKSLVELGGVNALRHVAWTPALVRRALGDGSFKLYAQRISPLRNGARPARFEVLLRMQNADTIYTPETFMDVARTGRLMPEIDRWVVRHSLQELSSRAELLCGRQVEFCINVDKQSLATPDFADFVVGEVSGCAVPPGLLTFEIAEPIVLEKEAAVESFATRISEAGCRVSLDHFGAGAGTGSLATLRRLPISCVKIDGSLVQDVTTNLRSESLIRGVASMTASMDMETVAEHVEQNATKEKLGTLGVDYAQGYAVSRPCPMDEALAGWNVERAA